MPENSANQLPMSSAATDAEAIRQPDAPDGICAPQARALSETRALLEEAQAAATSLQEEFLRAKGLSGK